MAKIGRPSKYDEKYCEQLVEFFDRPLFDTVKTSKVIKGVVVEFDQQIPGRLPTFERFAFDIGVHIDTLHEWKRVHPEFSEAYDTAKCLQKDILLQNGLNGNYNAGYAHFLTKCITDLKEDDGDKDSNRTYQLAYSV